jgi:4-amino-4-deoxy-L-arabinose transferase-like glycosyltransferase
LNNRSRITDWVLLLAVCAYFFLWQLAAFGLIGADEPRYAQVAREMLERNDWVTPTLSGTPWLEKPPLYYWQAMLAYRCAGVSDWAARLPSVFDAFLLVLAVYWFLLRSRSPRQLDAALVVATMAGVVGFARAASTDMPLAAMFGIAMLAWYGWFESGSKSYLAAAYAFLALAMLAKGPVAPFLAMALVAAFAALKKSAKVAAETLWVPGILIFLAVGLPWYVLVELRNPQFFHEFIVQHNLARFGSNLYRHLEPFWYYLPVTLLAWLPWTVFAVAALIRAPRQFGRPATDLRCFLLIWIAVVVFFFSLSQSKLPGYILPAMPAGAILAAEFLRPRSPAESLPSRARWGIAGLDAALTAALVFSALMIRPLIVRHQVPWNQAGVALLAALATAVLVCALLIKSDLRAWRLATLAPTIVALALALRLGSRGLDETLSARPVANQLASFERQHLPVAVFLTPRETQFGLAFYRNQVIDRYELGEVPAGEHLVVAAQGFEKSIAKISGRGVVYLGRFAPQKLEYFYVRAK